MDKKTIDKPSLYALLGVDAQKTDVRNTFREIIDNDFPGSFVNIVYDPNVSGITNFLQALFRCRDRRVLTQHADGDGSKSVQRVLHYLITGETEQLGYMLDDAFSMNTSDIAASGFVSGPLIVTQLLNSNLNSLRNGLKHIVMEELKNRWLELRSLYESHGFKIKFLGGETADLPQQIWSSVFDMTVTSFTRASRIIKGDVVPGDKIWGLSSTGRAVWEQVDNSGLMSKGLTLARTALVSREYNSISPRLRQPADFYRGHFLLDTRPEILQGLSISEALMSPTRQWAIVIKKLLDRLRAWGLLPLVHGISINTGGGATKIKHIGQGGIVYYKEMPLPAPIFQLIQQESGENWKYMFETFNCGIGIDILGKNDSLLEMILMEVASDCGIDCHTLGECLPHANPQENRVVLNTLDGNFVY
jgi:phosphoribosylformylglycinamidine cyclo-ligase